MSSLAIPPLGAMTLVGTQAGTGQTAAPPAADAARFSAALAGPTVTTVGTGGVTTVAGTGYGDRVLAGLTGTGTTTGSTGGAIGQVLDSLDQVAASPDVQQSPAALALVQAGGDLLKVVPQLVGTGSAGGTGSVSGLVGATITSLDDLKASPGVSGNPLATSMITAFESALQAIAQAAAQGGTGGVTAAAA